MIQNWMIPSNSSYYDSEGAFAKFGFIDWRQRYSFNIGDIAYIYATKPEARIKFKAKITEINIAKEDTIDDSDFWISGSDNDYDGHFMRLELISKIEDNRLCRENLIKHGFTDYLMTPRRISGELLDYIESCMESTEITYSDDIVEELPIELKEGATKYICVNAYERNPIAREKCIEYNGCKCAICGMDFEKTYGPVGKGFIHVHHIIPLSEINKEYKVDYKKDLIPVCPNCHAMLHRKINGKLLSVEELKQLLKHD